MSNPLDRVDEFESLFRASVKPLVEIEPLPFERLLVVLDSEGCDEKRSTVTAIAADMAERYRVDVRIIAPVRKLKREAEADTGHAEELLGEMLETIKARSGNQVSGEVKMGAPARVILDEVAAYSPSIILMSSLFGEAEPDLETFTLGAVTDRVLSSVSEPLLLVEGRVDEVEKLWRDILVYVEDEDTAGNCLSATRTLALKGAQVGLLHVIDSGWLKHIHRALEFASELNTEQATEAIERALNREMTLYLEAGVEALNKTGHVAHLEIATGDPIELTRDEITGKDHGLLICNSVAPDQKLIDSIAYNLAAHLREVPLLLV